MKQHYDFVIIGAGIIGLAIARALHRQGVKSICILEKEATLGKHASGRNSGVLHAGIYYSKDSLKAKFCTEGARKLIDYADANGITWKKTGKIILPKSNDEQFSLEFLFQRAKENGITIEKISFTEVKEYLPKYQPPKEFNNDLYALYSPNSAIIDSFAVLEALENELRADGIAILKSQKVERIKVTNRSIYTTSERIHYGHLVNTAGLYADMIAHQMGVGKEYEILPFKGIYRKLTKQAAKYFSILVYPVPDIRMPFLGVHITPTVAGDVLVGPTAIPALGRENYSLFSGITPIDFLKIMFNNGQLFLKNTQNFRDLALHEIPKYLNSNFVKDIQSLVPFVKAADLKPEIAKVGIRAQLFNIKKQELAMDFVVEEGPHSTHVLNAISPAFTASFAFADFVVQSYLKKHAGV